MSENNQQLIHFYWDGPGLYSDGHDTGGEEFVFLSKVTSEQDAKRRNLGAPRYYDRIPEDENLVVYTWNDERGWLKCSLLALSDSDQARRPATPYITYPIRDWLSEALMSLVDEDGERVLVVADRPGFLFDAVRREVSGCMGRPMYGRREARPLLFSDSRVRCLFVQPDDVRLGLPLKDFDVVIVVGISGGSHAYEQIKRKVYEPQRLILVGTTFLMPLEANNAS